MNHEQQTLCMAPAAAASEIIEAPMHKHSALTISALSRRHRHIRIYCYVSTHADSPRIAISSTELWCLGRRSLLCRQ
jgi:hypothetical protein